MNIYKNKLGLFLIGVSVAGFLHGADAEQKVRVAEGASRSPEEQLKLDKALLSACGDGDVDKVKLLLAQKADINLEQMVVHNDNELRSTTLSFTIENISNPKCVSCFKFLLDNGADVTIPIRINNFSLGQLVTQRFYPNIYYYISWRKNYDTESLLFSILDDHQEKLISLVQKAIHVNGTHFCTPLARIVAQYLTRVTPKESPLITAIMAKERVSIRTLMAQGDGKKPLIVYPDPVDGTTIEYTNLTDFMEHNKDFQTLDKDTHQETSEFLRSLISEQEKAETEAALTVIKE